MVWWYLGFWSFPQVFCCHLFFRIFRWLLSEFCARSIVGFSRRDKEGYDYTISHRTRTVRLFFLKMWICETKSNLMFKFQGKKKSRDELSNVYSHFCPFSWKRICYKQINISSKGYFVENHPFLCRVLWKIFCILRISKDGWSFQHLYSTSFLLFMLLWQKYCRNYKIQSSLVEVCYAGFIIASGFNIVAQSTWNIGKYSIKIVY